MPTPDLARFSALWHRLRATGDPAPIFENLSLRWAESHRHYHTFAHLDACLSALDRHRALATHPDTVEISLWFHDAVYDPHASDNEARSAALAISVLRAAQVAAPAIAKVERLILSTRTHQSDSDPDTALLLDLDLAILGASPAAYQSYAAAIRREYAWVPEPDYCAKRAAILTRFLQRPRLFLTAPFFASHETPARANLAQEIQTLSS